MKKTFSYRYPLALYSVDIIFYVVARSAGFNPLAIGFALAIANGVAVFADIRVQILRARRAMANPPS